MYGLRQYVSPDVLFGDIRDAILEGVIPSNQWNKPCYVLPDVTYVISPRGIECLVKHGLYKRDPKTELNVYLEALKKNPAVHRDSNGKVHVLITIRPGARPCYAIALDTRGLFRDETEISRVGIWTESQVQEVSEEKARAYKRPDKKPKGKKATHA